LHDVIQTGERIVRNRTTSNELAVIEMITVAAVCADSIAIKPFVDQVQPAS
jgi:hypothetical protein